MASLITHVVNWKEAVEAAKSGRLDGYLFPEDDIERPEGDYQIEDFAGTDSCNLFGSVGSAYQGLRRKLTADQRAKYDTWFWRVFGRMAGARKWYADDPKLFKDDAFQASFNPQTVSELARLGKTIRFEELRDAFYSKCPKDDLETLSEYSSNPKDPFKSCFLPYLRGWVKFFVKLDSKKWGVLFYVG
jgi:hypothetical protein